MLLEFDANALKRAIYDDPRENGMFEDVDVKFYAHLCLKFDVDVFEHVLFNVLNVCFNCGLSDIVKDIKNMEFLMILYYEKVFQLTICQENTKGY